MEIKNKMRLGIRNNEAWILRKKGSTSYTIYDSLKAVEEDLNKNIFQNIKKVELMKLTLTHNGGKLEQNDRFWMKIFLMNKKREP